MYEEYLKTLINEKINNNTNIKKFVSSHNKKQNLDFETQLLGGVGAVFSRDTYLLMLELGIPIGVVEYIDSKGNLLINEYDEPIGEIKHIYKPINDFKEYIEYLEINDFPYIIVNPSYMSKTEIRNLAYCLEQANNDMIFDFDTKNKMQIEIINNLPLKYEKAMRIFNKYFTETIQKKYIYEYGASRERFYELSGLKELIPVEKNKNCQKRNVER